MMKKILAGLLALILGTGTALAQTSPFSTFINGATDVGTVTDGLKFGASAGNGQARFATGLELTNYILAKNLGFLGNYTFAGTVGISGAFAAHSTVTFDNLGLGTQLFCLGLNAGNQIVLSSPGCGSGGGGAVASVFGRSGTVTAQTGDYSFSQVSGQADLSTQATGTLPATSLPNPTATTKGGVQSIVALSHNWVDSISTAGVPHQSQPAFTDLSGVLAVGQIAGSPVSHSTPIDVGGTPTWKIIPDCQDTLGNHINYTQSSDAWSCGTSSSGGGGGAINVSDGTHTVNSTTTLNLGNGFVVGGTSPTATVNLSATVVTKTANYTAGTVDLTNAINLGGSGAQLTLPAGLFTPGATIDFFVSASGPWTLVNSTGLTLAGLNSTTLQPGTSGSFVEDADGVHLDVFAGLQVPTTTALGGVFSSSAPAHQFANGISTGGGVNYAQPAVGDLASISDGTVVANISGVPAAPSASTVSAVLDYALGSTVGVIAYRSNAGWTALPPPLSAGTYTLQITGGAGNTPFWTASSVQPCTPGQLSFNVACNASFYMIGVN